MGEPNTEKMVAKKDIRGLIKTLEDQEAKTHISAAHELYQFPGDATSYHAFANSCSLHLLLL
jgi:hypothetical protein